MMSGKKSAYIVTTAFVFGLFVMYLVTDRRESRSSVVAMLRAPEIAKGVVPPSVPMVRKGNHLSEWTPVETNNRAGCETKTNIVFLKTHKTASSTMANIMYRFGERRNLTFALPLTSNRYIDVKKLPKNLVPSPTGIYNILTNHARFNPQAFKETMPLDTSYVTIIRDPKTQFESLYSFFNCGTAKSIGVPIEQFLRNTQRYTKNLKGTKMCKVGIRNPQLYDLGLSSVDRKGQSPSTLDESVDKWIGVLDKSFHLVLIAEYFEESLVALKELMCWDIDDVVVFTLNRRQTRPQEDKMASLNDLITKWNSGDVKLYQHFNRTFWRKIELIGRDKVSREKAAIQKRTSELVNRCLYTKAVQTRKIIVNTLKSEMKNDPLCQRMVRKTPAYLNHLRRKMTGKYKS